MGGVPQAVEVVDIHDEACDDVALELSCTGDVAFCIGIVLNCVILTVHSLASIYFCIQTAAEHWRIILMSFWRALFSSSLFVCLFADPCNDRITQNVKSKQYIVRGRCCLSMDTNIP